MTVSQPNSKPHRSVIHRLARVLLKILATIVIILVLVVILIQTPFIQNIVRSKAESYLSRKLKTKVAIGSLYIKFPQNVVLKNIYLEDMSKDTLLSAGLVDVHIRMWGLLHSEVDIPSIQLGDITAKIKRQLPDTAFNFQFIADAFAGPPDTTTTKAPSKPMKFSLGELDLDRIRVVYMDVVTGNDVEAWIGHSKTTMQAFDPMALRFEINKFQIDSLEARVQQDKPLLVAASSATPETSTSTPMQLALGTIDLTHSRLEYLSNVNAMYTRWQVASLHTNFKEFDLDKQRIGIDQLKLDGTDGVVRVGPEEIRKAARNITATAHKAAVKSGATPVNSSAGWSVKVAGVELNRDNIEYDDNTQPLQKKGMDYAHMRLEGLTLHAADLAYNKDSISGRLTQGSFTEKSGFKLEELRTAFLYTEKGAVLKGLLLRTPGSLIQRDMAISYSSVDRMMTDPAHTLIDLNMPNSRIAVRDILLLVPSLASQPALKPTEVWQVNTRVKGSLDVLHIQSLQVSGIGDITVDVAGAVSHPMDTQRVSADLDLHSVAGSRAALLALLPKGVVPNNIAVPTRFRVQGKLKGSMTGVNTDLAIRTSSGDVIVKGLVQDFRNMNRAVYDLNLKTQSLDLGYILKDTLQFGKVTADFAAKGRGFDPQTAEAALHGVIHAAVLRKYEYNDLIFDGAIAQRHLELQTSIHDEAISMDLKASGEIPAADSTGSGNPGSKGATTMQYPSIRLDWQIDTLDLHALHFVTDTLAFSGHIGADMASTNPDALQGKLSVSKLALLNGTQNMKTDSIVLIAARQDSLQTLQLRSEMADLDWKGKYKLTETALAIQHTIDRYYRLNGLKDTSFAAQDWTLQMHLRPSPLVLAMMPSLKGTDTAFAVMSFNSDRNDLRLSLKDPVIKFGSQTLNNIVVTASTTDNGSGTASVFGPASGGSVANNKRKELVDAIIKDTTAMLDSTRRLQYRVSIADGNGAGFQLHQTSLSGYLSNNKLFTTVLLKDSKGKDRYRVGTALDKLPDGLKLILDADSLMLNYDKWQVSRDNYILYDSSGVVVSDFKISNSSQALSIQSNPPAANSPIDVKFDNFKLNTLSRFVDQDSLLVDGTLNGKAEVRDVLGNPVFTSDLAISSLSFKADTLGDLKVKVDNKTANAFAAEIGLQGNKNDLEVKGIYYTGEGKMDLNLDLRQMNLAVIKPFASDQIEDIRGLLKGKLKIQGTIDEPKINGGLHFDSALIVPVITGEPLKLSKDNIEFDADGFNFSQFSMQDSAGNKATLDGNVYTSDYRDFEFDMSFNANNFRLVNAPESNARLFYGKMNLDMAMSLQGDMNAPKVDGDIRINKKTNFYFVLPGSDPEMSSRDGVVRFIDHQNPGDTLVSKPIAAVKEIVLKGIDASLNIQTDSSAIFTMVIDERNGDALTVRGRSNLVFAMDPRGRMELTGGYEVESGSYNLSFNLLKRKFDIVRGSTITWTGDIMKATVDITANYTANTPSIDLIDNELAGRSPTDVNKFKQKLPFLVTLKMEGDLLKPKITFDISLPQNILALWPDVDQKLQQIRVQESELNKQVFALLLLNRFVGENPLQSASGGGTDVGRLAFQSASQILTNQLDQLAGSLIKGVDIHFDLNNQQDYTSGQERDYTELNVTVSKQFSDRVTVNVGSNFDVQGTQASNSNASNLAGDVAVDYKLTKDGRYMVRAYRKNQYQAVVEGQVVETGVSFILTFDYNKFREIFGRTREEKLEERSVTKPKK